MINKYKNFCLEKNIYDIITFLDNLEKHLTNIYKRYYINNDIYLNILNKINYLNNLIKNNYNNTINKFLKNDSSEYVTNKLLELINKIPDYNILYDLCQKYMDIKDFLCKEELLTPLNTKEYNEKIKEILTEIGYPNLEEIFKRERIEIKNDNLLIILKNYFLPLHIYSKNRIIITKKINEIINESNGLFTNEYFMYEIEKKNNNIIEKNYEFVIKRNKLWYVIEGIFTYNKINIFNEVYSKISLHPIYQKKKILLELYHDDKFKVKYINNASIEEFLILTFEKWQKVLEEKNNLYLKLHNMTNEQIMSDFLNLTDHKKMYEMIKLLLLSSSDHNQIASIMFYMLKNKPMIGEKILLLLPYNLQIKLLENVTSIKKSEINKYDIKNVKSYLKNNNNIPDSVKNSIIEKINENNNDNYKQQLYIKLLSKFPWDEPPDVLSHLNNDQKKCRKYIENIENKFFNQSYGHKDVKKQLILQISKWISNPSSGGCVIGLYGPPGVGKTMIAKKISEILSIPFISITLGGQNDASLIHGHSYTYNNSQPGIIIKKIVEVETRRCVLYLDELDKCSNKNGENNEISSVLIHLTDTNSTFQDRFFDGIDFPMDKLIIIASYNDRSKIDPILLDRFYEIEVKPYMLNEKIEIAKQYLIPELINNINPELNININNELIEYIITNYTLEAGVRELKRKLEQLILEYNKLYIQNKVNNNINIEIDDIHKIIDIIPITEKKIYDKSLIGIVNGLYATVIGNGGILPIQIQSNFTPGNFIFNYTGQQSEVMKESISCAYTAAINYLITINPNILEDIKNKFPYGFHIHIPSAGVKKDGPSAGCAFVIGFISRILNKAVKNTIAMTGEIDLNGNITKIGGLIEKLHGAKNAQVLKVYVPYENYDEVEKIAKEYPLLFNDNFKIYYVTNITELVNCCFE